MEKKKAFRTFIICDENKGYIRLNPNTEHKYMYTYDKERASRFHFLETVYYVINNMLMGTKENMMILKSKNDFSG